MSSTERAHPTLRRRRGALRVALAALVVPALLASACGGNSNDDGAGAGKLKVLIVKHPLTKSMSDMAWVKQLEKDTGTTIEWQEISADWDQKKSTILAAGDVPDLVIGTNPVTDSDLSTYGSLFEDLSDDLDAMPNVKSFLDEVDGAKETATQESGAVYALPSWKQYWPQAITRQYVNQQWLDNLGLAQPKTWDELYDVLLAFKTQDANGNGDPNDEIPMDWSPVDTTGYGYFQPTQLLGSLGLTVSGGGGTGYFVEDGKVGNFLGDERWKQVLEFLSKCYAAGLISPDVMTQDYSAFQSAARGDGNTAKVGFSWGWTASDRFGSELAPQYASTAPLLAKAGQTEPVTWGYDFENLSPNHILVSAQTSDKAAALKVVDAFYGQDLSIETLWGDEGTDTKKVDDKTYEVLPPADGTSDPSTWKWTETIADNAPGWIRDDLNVTLPTDLAEAVEQSKPLEAALANVDPDSDVWPPYLKMSTDDLNTVALNNTTILNLTQTKFAQWITSGGVDTEWDDYTAQLKAAGLDANVKIYQKYYDQDHS